MKSQPQHTFRACWCISEAALWLHRMLKMPYTLGEWPLTHSNSSTTLTMAKRNRTTPSFGEVPFSQYVDPSKQKFCEPTSIAVTPTGQRVNNDYLFKVPCAAPSRFFLFSCCHWWPVVFFSIMNTVLTTSWVSNSRKCSSKSSWFTPHLDMF